VILLGIVLTVFVGLIFSWILPQKMSQQQKNIALACTYKGLKVPFNKFKQLPTQENEENLVLK
jgi:hypothetical protein